MSVRGPAPDPNSLRSTKVTWTSLPAAGRQGEPPAWPLTRATAAERRQWVREWARPQAVEWEAAGQIEEVAIYVRNLHAEKPDMSVLIRQQMALGLSQDGLARHHWRIEDTAGRAQSVRTDDPDLAARKTKLRAIAGGAA